MHLTNSWKKSYKKTDISDARFKIYCFSMVLCQEFMGNSWEKGQWFWVFIIVQIFFHSIIKFFPSQMLHSFQVPYIKVLYRLYLHYCPTKLPTQILYIYLIILTNQPHPKMHPKYSALFTSVNLLLGVGPLIIPMPFFDAGLGLSSIWMVIICILSYNSAMYINQSMNKLVQIEHNRNHMSIQSEDRQNNDSILTSNSIVNEENQTQETQSKKMNQYGHAQQFNLLFGEKWQLFPSIAITVYLLGTSISKCIMTAKTLSIVFSHVNTVGFLRNYNFWLAIFFLAGALFSFRSIDKTKVMQAIIIGARVITILLFFGGAVFIFCRDGVKELTPPKKGFFNFGSFVQIFSNSVFSLMFHHSLPNIVGNLKTTQDVRFVIRNAFIISGSILLILPITAAMAFGKDLGVGSELIFYNFDFQHKIPFIYWITSFYVFLNIAAFSVYIIVIRTNILNIILPSVNPRVFNKQTLITSIIILAFILWMSSKLQSEITIVLDITGGIFGIFILFHIPAAQVWKARKLIYIPGNPRNYIKNLPIFIAVLGFVFMGFNLYHIIVKIENQ